MLMRKALLIGLVVLLVLLSGCVEQSIKELESCMAKCQEVCKLVNQNSLDLEGFNQLQLTKTKDSLTIDCSCPCANETSGKPEKFYCETDSDCVFADNCGEFDKSPLCVNNNWWLQTYGIGPYNCPSPSSKGCTCVKNRCGTTNKQPNVSISTDKSEYSLDENRINLAIKNNSAKSIWYVDYDYSCTGAAILRPKFLLLYGDAANINPPSGDASGSKWIKVPLLSTENFPSECWDKINELKPGEKITTEYQLSLFHDPAIFLPNITRSEHPSFIGYKLGFEYAFEKETLVPLTIPTADVRYKTLTGFSNEFNISAKLNECDTLEQEIKTIAEEIKSCKKDDDCILDQNLPHNCAIGCYVIRSKLSDNTRILEILIEDNNNYMKKCPLCLMKCPAPPAILICAKHKCIGVNEVLPVPAPPSVTCNRTWGTGADKKDVNAVYQKYLEAGQNCDINLANSIITEKSKEIVRFTCSNMADEVKCYIGRNTEIRVLQDTAVIYLTPFGHVIENPFLFTKENGAWKLDLYRMSNSIAMGGYTCDTGWGWRTDQAKEEFCCHFPEGNCPEEEV